MALKEYKLPFGRGFQTVMLPEERVSDVLEGVPTAACDIKEATVECMRHPIGSAPLAEKVQKGDKVCLIIADITRAWNHARDFTVHVVNELNLAGIPDEDIFIVFAQGTHRAHTDAENIECVGPWQFLLFCFPILCPAGPFCPSGQPFPEVLPGGAPGVS